MPQVGDTVKLKSKFYDFSGNEVNADGDVELRVYDKDKQLIETITDGIDNPSVGEYQYDYHIPEEFGYLSFGFYCEIGGKPAFQKARMPIKWDDKGW